MRIRKRPPQSCFSSAPLPDLQLNRSAVVQQQISPLSNGNRQLSEAKPESDDPLKQPSDQTMVMSSERLRWVLHPDATTEDKIKQTELESKEVIDEISSSNDIRNARILVQQVDIKVAPPLSSSAPDGRWSTQGEYKVVPLKKRKEAIAESSSITSADQATTAKARMKSKTNKKLLCLQLDKDTSVAVQELVVNNNDEEDSKKKGKKRSGNVLMEGSRCSRVNGRGWRCCQPTLVGYALCEHHLGKGRLRSISSTSTVHKRRGTNNTSESSTISPNNHGMSSVLRDVDLKGLPTTRSSNCLVDDDNEKMMKPVQLVTKKRTKLGMVKARSLSTLLGLHNIDSQ